MRPLIIDGKARAKVAKVLAHAEKHHYYPEKLPLPPGNDPNFVTHLSTYRCVFSFTHIKGHIYRHLSISVPSKKFPNPAAAFAIADLFGFTGYDEKHLDVPGLDWMIQINDSDHCVVIAQMMAVETGGKYDA